MWRAWRKSIGLCLLVVPVLAIALASCGGSGERATPQVGRAAAPSTRGLPAALAANVRQVDRIVGEGGDALRMKLDQLRGYPVVINQWASWCTSCRFEFAFFRSASARFRDKVAFLGLDSADDKANAEKFLKETPGGFPSIFDPKASLARSFGGGRAFPMTFFLDKVGKQVHTQIGAYAKAELLERDIERYALGQGVGEPSS